MLTYICDIGALSLELTVTNATCWGMQGSVLPLPSGGTAPYSVTYQGQTTNITHANISAALAIDVGSYDAYLRDTNDCEFGPVHIIIYQPGIDNVAM